MATILDSRTLRPLSDSGTRGGYDGAKRRSGSKLHLAVTGDSVEVAFVDQGYTGETAAAAAEASIELVVVKLAEAKKGFVLLPRRWVIERSFAWVIRFRRLVRKYERFADLHLVTFVYLVEQAADFAQSA